MSEENVEVVRRCLDALAREDFAAMLECFAPEVEFIPLRAATEGGYRGREGVEKFTADTFENFETFEPRLELRGVGSHVLAWGTIHMRGRGSGVEMDAPSGGVFEVRDGKIVRWRDYGSKEKAVEAAELRE